MNCYQAISNKNFKKKKSVFLLRFLNCFWGLAIFIAFWQVSVVLGDIPEWLLPAPLDVLDSLIRDSWLLLSHTVYTFVAAFTGFILSVVLGVIIALIIDYWPLLGAKVYPLLVLSQTVPIITVAPLIIIWLGYGLLPKVLVAVLVCFFPIVINTTGGLQSADNDLADLMKVMGASRWQVIRLARIPAALPSFFSGLKISATYCVMAAVIGEWLGASKGLGVVLTRASHSFQMGRVFAAITVIVFISLMFYLLIEAVARVSIPWHYRKQQG